MKCKNCNQEIKTGNIRHVCKERPLVDITDLPGSTLRVVEKAATDPLGTVNKVVKSITGFPLW